MSDKTGIEYAEATWNPETGCTPISSGCLRCYAKREAGRLKAMGSKKYAQGFCVTLHMDELEQPSRWKKPRRIFVCSMGDLFHEAVPSDFIWEVLQQVPQNPQHTFLVLTKRPQRMVGLVNAFARDFSGLFRVLGNLWVGVTVENRLVLPRIDQLRQVHAAAVRFVSFEPLLGSLGELNLAGIDWAIAGGESGHNCRPCYPNDVREVRDQCIRAGVPFFFKQWGGEHRKQAGRLLDGREWNEYPRVASVAESAT